MKRTERQRQFAQAQRQALLAAITRPATMVASQAEVREEAQRHARAGLDDHAIASQLHLHVDQVRNLLSPRTNPPGPSSTECPRVPKARGSRQFFDP